MVYSWGESLGQRRTDWWQAIRTSVPWDGHNSLFLVSVTFLTAVVLFMLYLISYDPLRAEQPIGNKC